MSSACVCHLDEWCFYCEMYSPLESKFELQEIENAALKQEIEQLKERNFERAKAIWESGLSFADALKENDRLKAQNSALLECVKWYASLIYGGTARECIAKLES